MTAQSKNSDGPRYEVKYYFFICNCKSWNHFDGIPEYIRPCDKCDVLSMKLYTDVLSFEELTKLQEEKTWIHSVTPVGYKSTLKRDENE